MNTGIFGEGFPYSNFHDLNMDWIIKIAKDFLDQYTHIQEIIQQGKEDIETLTESGITQIGDLTATSLQDLEDKKDTLEALLQDWYDTHSEDIANELADALSDLNNWYTTHQNYLDNTLATKTAEFIAMADAKASDTLASIPSDYTELSNEVIIIDENLKDNFNLGIGKIGQKRIEDCTSLISQAQTLTTRFAKNPSYFKGGKLKSVTFKQYGAMLLRFFIAVILEDGTIKKEGTFVINTLIGTHTYINGVDFIYDKKIPENALIGYQYTLNGGYFGGLEGSYNYAGAFNNVDSISSSDYTTPSYGIGISCEYESICEDIENTIEKYLNGIKYGKLIPQNTYVLAEKDIIHVRANYVSSTNSELKLIRNADVSTEASRVEFVNFGSNTIGFYKTVGHASDASVIQKQYVLPFSFTVGHTYDIHSIKLNANISILTINDIYTANHCKALFINTENNLYLGSGWGYRTYTAGSGVSVDFIHNYSIQPEKSMICMIGDSYVESNALLAYPNDYDKRFSNLVSKKLGGDMFTWAQGGASSGQVYTWLSTILNLNESKYYLICVGMNDENFQTWQGNIENILSTIETNHGIPILCTIPPTNLASNEEHMLMNQYIRQSGIDFIDIAKIMSANNNGITVDLSKFLSDGVHPTPEVHEIIYQTIFSAFPQIFGSTIA